MWWWRGNFIVETAAEAMYVQQDYAGIVYFKPERGCPVRLPVKFFKIQPKLNIQPNQFCQFFVVLYKIWHDRTTKLHGRSPQISKKNKLGNLYNDRSTLKNGNQKTRFFNVDRSLYEFPYFVFLVIWGERPCNFVVRSCQIYIEPV